MTEMEKVIAKLEKEVKKTYLIKTTTYNNGKKVNEEITEHRESGIKMSMEMANKILAMLKEQEAVEPKVTCTEQRCGNCNKVIEMDGWKSCPWCGKMIDWERWWNENGTHDNS